MPKRPDKFKRWMIASFFLIPLVLLGSIGVYYVRFPIKMHIFIFLFRYQSTAGWALRRVEKQEARAIPYLPRALKSKNRDVRRRCLSAFGSDPDGVLKSNKRYFYSPGGPPYFYSPGGPLVDAGAMKDKRVRQAVIELLGDPDGSVQWAALKVLMLFFDDDVVSDLIAALNDSNDSDVGFRVRVATLLERIGDKRAPPALIKCLRDSHLEVRLGAIRALGKIGSKEAAPDLIKCLSDPEVWVRGSAAEALGAIGSESAIGPLIVSLKERPKQEPEVGSAALHFCTNAVKSLEKTTGQSFGDVEKASDAQRQKIIQKWLEWWEENKEKYEAGVTTETADSVD